MEKTECCNCGYKIEPKENVVVSKFVLCPNCRRYTPVNANSSTRLFKQGGKKHGSK